MHAMPVQCPLSSVYTCNICIWTTYTTAGGDGDLDGIAACLAHVLQVERLVASLALRRSLDHQGCCVHTHL